MWSPGSCSICRAGCTGLGKLLICNRLKFWIWLTQKKRTRGSTLGAAGRQHCMGFRARLGARSSQHGLVAVNKLHFGSIFLGAGSLGFCRVALAVPA